MDKIADIERFINNTVLKWIDIAEQSVSDSLTANASNDQKSRLIMDRAAKMEDALKEHIDIIQTLNKKVNLNHESIDDVKHLLQNKLTRFEDDLLNKKNDMVPFQLEIRNLEANIWKMGEEIDLMRID